VFQLRTMLEESFKLQPGLSLDMLYFDAYESEPTNRLMLYLSADGEVSEPRPLPSEAELRRGLTREKNLPVGDRQWQVLYRASPEWLESQYSRVPFYYLLTCLGITGLSAALVYVLQRRHAFIESAGRPSAPPSSTKAGGSWRAWCRPCPAWPTSLPVRPAHDPALSQ
jgi:hypothetical protein